MNKKFSNRYEFKTVEETPITIREEAPSDMRCVVLDIALQMNISPYDLRKIICSFCGKTLKNKKRSDFNNWLKCISIRKKLQKLMDNCKWYYIYDIIETISLYLSIYKRNRAHEFENEINQYFQQTGIGWRLKNGKIEYRGNTDFEFEIKKTDALLEKVGLSTSASEIKAAISDLSKRPNPDITGSIQHGLAALECVAREVTGGSNATLGKILNDRPGIFPKPLDAAMEKIWGYASNMGRHLKEGNSPSYDEAEFAVYVSAAACSYLIKKLKIK